MDIRDAIKGRRSIRKFKQTPIEEKMLIECVEAGRLAAQGANMQPIKYVIVNEKQLADAIFPFTKWAGYLAPNYNPKENEIPVAYIVLLCDQEIKKEAGVDVGAVGQNILLSAYSQGLGSCWLGAIDRPKIKELLNIPDRYQINSMIALGYPDESPQMVEINEGDSIKYYLDDGLKVPKRKIDDIVFYNKL